MQNTAKLFTVYHSTKLIYTVKLFIVYYHSKILYIIKDVDISI